LTHYTEEQHAPEEAAVTAT